MKDKVEEKGEEYRPGFFITACALDYIHMASIKMRYEYLGNCMINQAMERLDADHIADLVQIILMLSKICLMEGKIININQCDIINVEYKGKLN